MDVSPNQMPELTDRDVCFMLIESPVNGVVMTCNPRMELIHRVICAWIEADGPDVLRRAKPDVIESADDHWVTMPRSILNKFDYVLDPGLTVKIVAMHVRVFAVVHHRA